IIEIEVFGGLGGPQAQGVDGLAAIADDRKVVRHTEDGLCLNPVPLTAVGPRTGFDTTFEFDRKRELGMRDFPGIAELEPFIGLFDLVSVKNPLVKDAEVIAEAVADGGQAEGGHGIEE